MPSRWLGLACVCLLVEVWNATGASLLIPGKSSIQSTNVPKISLEGVARRDSIQEVVDRPTLYARGPGESFYGKPEQYYWFLDHPDRAVIAWRRLGARCVSISPRGQGLFGWSDETGSEVTWETVAREPGQRIWFAEGKVKPGPLLAPVPIKVVVVLRHHEGKAADGGTMIHHQADLYMHTDSKSAALVTKMLGNSSQRLAEQGLGQLQLFFGGLCWYLDRHPDQAANLLKE